MRRKRERQTKCLIDCQRREPNLFLQRPPLCHNNNALTLSFRSLAMKMLMRCFSSVCSRMYFSLLMRIAIFVRFSASCCSGVRESIEGKHKSQPPYPQSAGRSSVSFGGDNAEQNKTVGVRGCRYAWRGRVRCSNS